MLLLLSWLTVTPIVRGRSSMERQKKDQVVVRATKGAGEVRSAADAPLSAILASQ
jgi:hypothetical protein